MHLPRPFIVRIKLFNDGVVFVFFFLHKSTWELYVYMLHVMSDILRNWLYFSNSTRNIYITTKGYQWFPRMAFLIWLFWIYHRDCKRKVAFFIASGIIQSIFFSLKNTHLDGNPEFFQNWTLKPELFRNFSLSRTLELESFFKLSDPRISVYFTLENRSYIQSFSPHFFRPPS